MHAFDFDAIELGTVVMGLADRIRKHAETAEQDEDFKNATAILTDWIGAREKLITMLDGTRKKGKLAERAYTFGALGRPLLMANLLLMRYADLFTFPAKQFVARVERSDPDHNHMAFKAFWTVVGADSETLVQAMNRVRFVENVLRDVK